MSTHEAAIRPEWTQTVTAQLIIAEAAKAINFYATAFGAQQMFRLDAPNGKLMHACLRIGNSYIFIADEFPEWGARGPLACGGTTVSLYIYAENPDALFDRAVAAGAKSVLPMGDAFWGDRYGQIEDPFGHRWALACRQRDVSIDEMREALQKMPECS